MYTHSPWRLRGTEAHKFFNMNILWALAVSERQSGRLAKNDGSALINNGSSTKYDTLETLQKSFRVAKWIAWMIFAQLSGSKVEFQEFLSVGCELSYLGQAWENNKKHFERFLTLFFWKRENFSLKLATIFCSLFSSRHFRKERIHGLSLEPKAFIRSYAYK